MKRVLIVVDVQHDFIDGSLAVPNAREIIPFINEKLEYGHYDLVIGTQDWHPVNHVSFASTYQDKKPFVDTIQAPYGEQRLWPDHCVQGRSGAEFWFEMLSEKFEIILRKGLNRFTDSYSAFFDAAGTKLWSTKLINYEWAVDIVGLATDYCVKFTAMDALKFTDNVNVLLQGCRGVAEETTNAAIEEMRKAGIVVVK